MADFLAGPEVATIGQRRVRSVLGPLPLTTLVGAGAYELAVHALDLAPAGAPAAVREPALRRPRVAGRHHRRAGGPLRDLDHRSELRLARGRAGPSPHVPGAWTTIELPDVPAGVVGGGRPGGGPARRLRRPPRVPAMLARRELRLHHVAGLLSLAPIVEAVPGLPGGSALRLAVPDTCAGSAG